MLCQEPQADRAPELLQAGSLPRAVGLAWYCRCDDPGVHWALPAEDAVRKLHQNRALQLGEILFRMTVQGFCYGW